MQALGFDHIDTLSTWNNVGCCLDCLDRAEEARYRFQLAFNGLKPKLLMQHPRTIVVHRNLQRQLRKPNEMHLGAAPFGLRFRPDKEMWIPGELPDSIFLPHSIVSHSAV